MADTDTQDVQQTPDFVQGNADLYQGAPPRWEDVKDQFTSAFPDLDPAAVKQEYTKAWNLGAARHLADNMQETGYANPVTGLIGESGSQFMRHWLPLAGTVQGLAIKKRYSDYQDKIDSGQAGDNDYLQFALHEKMLQEDAGQGAIKQLAQGGIKMAGEAVLAAPFAAGAAGAIPAAEGGSLAARAGLGAAKLGTSAAVNTALIPSAGAENVVNTNLAAGRNATDPRGLPQGLAQAFAQQAVFEAAGGVSGKALGLTEQSGLKAALSRTALAGVETPFLQQGADLVNYSAGLQTGYGTLQELLQGKYGDAGKNVAAQVVTGALMHGVHEGMGADGAHARLDDAAARLKEQAAKGYSVEAAGESVVKHYEAAGPEPGIDREGAPTPAPGHTENGIEPIPGEFPQRPAALSPSPEIDAASEAAPPNVPEPGNAPPEPAQPGETEQGGAEPPSSAPPSGLDVETKRQILKQFGKAAGKTDAETNAAFERAGLGEARETTKAPEPQKPATYQGESAPEAPPHPLEQAAGTGDKAAALLAKLKESPDYERIKGQVPEGSKLLGEVNQAFAFQTPDGDVVRVGPKQDRPNVPQMLQPTSRSEHGDWMVERLPHLDKVGDRDVFAQAYKPLSEGLRAQGYHPSDLHPGNVGLQDGKPVILDPGAVTKLPAAVAARYAGKATPEPAGSHQQTPAPNGAPEPAGEKPTLAQRLAQKRLNKGLKAEPSPGFTTEGATLEPAKASVEQVRASLQNLGLLLQHAREQGARPTPEGTDEAAQNRAMVEKGLNAKYWQGEHRKATDAVIKDPSILTHIPEFDDEIAADARSLGHGPETVRRAVVEQLQEDLRGNGVAPADEGAGPPAPAHPEREGASAVPAPAGNELSFGERQSRDRAERNHPDVFQDADEQGVPREHVHQAAAQMHQEDNQAVAEHNAILKDASNLFDHFTGRDQESLDQRQKGKGRPSLETLVKRGKTEDPNQGPAWDLVADAVARKYPGHFNAGQEGEEARDAGQDVLDAVNQGRRQPKKRGDFLRPAVDWLIEHRGKLDGLTEAQQAHAPAEVAEAVSSGLREGAQAADDAAREQGVKPDAPGDPEDAGSAAEPEHGVGGGPTEVEPGVFFRRPPGGPDPAARNPVRSYAGDFLPDGPAGLLGLADHLLRDEGGAVNLDAVKALALNLWHRTEGARDFFAKLGSRVAPNTQRISRTAADAIAGLDGAPGEAHYRTQEMIDRILGKDATQDDRVKLGAVLTERRLRYARQAFMDESAKASHQAAQLRAQANQDKANGYQQHPADVWQQMISSAADRATQMMRSGQAVKGTLGWQGNPLQSTADYRAALQDPKVQKAMQAWDQNMVPIMEDNFRRSQGLDPTDPINSLTQVPGSPVNLKALSPDEPDTPTTAGAIGRGNLRNVRQGKLAFSNEFSGTADRYDLDAGNIINNSLTKGYQAAAKAEMFRTLVSEGLAEWGKPGEEHYFNGVRARGDLDVRPPAGTQEAQQGQTALYADPRVYGELRQVLGVDQPLKLLGKAGTVLNAINITGIADALAHTRNISSMLLRGVSPADLFSRTLDVIRNDAAVNGRLADLAHIDALQAPRGHGMLPQLGGADPTSWVGRALETYDQAMRLAADDFFQRRAAKGDIVADETARRNFINQVGNYSKKTQSKLVAALRDTGLGPFATAGANWNMNALKVLAGDTGLEGKTAGADLKLRAGMYARTIGALATVPLLNYLLWGRVDGDDKTPLGSIKVGTHADGTTSFVNAASWLGVDRATRLTGLNAFGEGARTKRPLAHSADKALEDMIEGWGHPAMGPLPQALYTTATGKNTLGIPVAGKPGPGGSQVEQNAIAAAKNLNPAVAAALGANGPQKNKGLLPKTGGEALERAGTLLRPLGYGERKNPPGKDTGLIRR